jgi:hypothetical protein
VLPGRGGALPPTSGWSHTLWRSSAAETQCYTGVDRHIGDLRDIVAGHLAQTGIRTFIIGMEGASEDNLEQLASAGGAQPHDDWCGDSSPPCHYWNVGNGSGDAIASALQAIIQMATPLPCQFAVGDLTAPEGETLDYDRVNVTLTENDITTTIARAPSAASCPAGDDAWHYDDARAPTQIHLCPSTCTRVAEAGDGASVNVVVGCQESLSVD